MSLLKKNLFVFQNYLNFIYKFCKFVPRIHLIHPSNILNLLLKSYLWQISNVSTILWLIGGFHVRKYFRLIFKSSNTALKICENKKLFKKRVWSTTSACFSTLHAIKSLDYLLMKSILHFSSHTWQHYCHNGNKLFIIVWFCFYLIFYFHKKTLFGILKLIFKFFVE